MIDDLLLKRLMRCRAAKITIRSAVPDAGDRHIRVRLTGRRFESVSFTLRKGETFTGLVRRALNELEQRQQRGMPKLNPRVAERRRLRALLHSAKIYV